MLNASVMNLNIEMVPVSSSQVASVGYNEEKKILRVKYVSGGIYDYHDVPARIFDEMLQAESVGKYMHQHVTYKGSKFSYKKVGG